jgi:hypothetical protein
LSKRLLLALCSPTPHQRPEFSQGQNGMHRTHMRQPRMQEHEQGERKSRAGQKIGKTDEALLTEDEDEDLEARSIELITYLAAT